MIFELSILNILILFGAFQGFLLSVILLTTERLRKRSNQYLAMLLFTLALLNFVSTFEMPPHGFTHEIIRYHPFFLVNLIPPSIYFFILYLTNPNYQWKNRDYLFFLPIVGEVVFRLFKFSFYLRDDLLSESAHRTFNIIGNTFELLAVIYTIAIIYWSIKTLKKYESQLYENYSEVKSHSLSWLKNVLVTGIILTLLWFVVTITDYTPNLFSINLAMSTLLCLAVLIYWVGYSMIIRQELLDTPIFAIAKDYDNGQENNELSEKTEKYYEKLLTLMNEQELYRDPELNMTLLSQKTGLSNSYLSQIINQKEGKNFFDFVNEYRVREVKEKMNDPSFAHYTILALAQDAGFGSKSTFNAYFKKSTGKTPSEYKRSLHS